MEMFSTLTEESCGLKASAPLSHQRSSLMKLSRWQLRSRWWQQINANTNSLSEKGDPFRSYKKELSPRTPPAVGPVVCVFAVQPSFPVESHLLTTSYSLLSNNKKISTPLLFILLNYNGKLQQDSDYYTFLIPCKQSKGWWDCKCNFQGSIPMKTKKNIIQRHAFECSK